MFILDKEIDSSKPFSEIEIKKSKFLTYLYRISFVDSIKHNSSLRGEAKAIHSNHSTNNTNDKLDSILSALRAEHKKAVHFCLASRMINNHKQIIESSSDDGEPKGSAGAPILEVLRGEGMIDTICIVVRYFGGTKLGVGGLVRAYTQAALDSIKYAKEQGLVQEYKEMDSATISKDISKYNHIAYLLNEYGLEVVDKEFLGDRFSIKVLGESGNLKDFLVIIDRF